MNKVVIIVSARFSESVKFMEKSNQRQATMVRTVVLLKCLRGSGYFQTGNATADGQNNQELSHDELYIGKLLFHFQTGIQYNLHAVYQVSGLNI